MINIGSQKRRSAGREDAQSSSVRLEDVIFDMFAIMELPLRQS